MWERDKDDIRHQIDTTLRAYIDQDWGKLRQTHAPDWCGFALQSPAILKGRDALITAAERTMQTYRFLDYEMIEIDYRFWGNMCVVPYVVRVRGTAGGDKPFEARLQSMCVYLKQQDEWRLSASDLHVLPVEEALSGKV